MSKGFSAIYKEYFAITEKYPNLQRMSVIYKGNLQIYGIFSYLKEIFHDLQRIFQNFTRKFLHFTRRSPDHKEISEIYSKISEIYKEISQYNGTFPKLAFHVFFIIINQAIIKMKENDTFFA